MPSLHRAALLALLVACTRGPAPSRVAAPAPPTPTPPAPAAAPPPQVAPAAPRAEQLTFADSDAGLAFADPERRGKLAAAFGAIDAAVEDERKKQQVPGLALGIVIDGELAYAKGFGVTDLESKAAPDADTVYRIGSISKSFTGLALLSLRDDGVLGLDDPLARWIPEASQLVYPTRDARPITLRQMLTHTSGLPRMGSYDPERAPSEDAMVKSLPRLALDNTPGVLWSYSNLGFSLLGIVVGRAAHAPLHDVVGKRIFQPLGMTSTFWERDQVPANRLAPGYEPTPAGPAPKRDLARLGAGDGAGGIYSTVRDMARYAAFQLSAYPPRNAPDDGPIRRATLREAHSTGVQTRSAMRVEAAPRKGERLADYEATSYSFGWSRSHTCDFDDVVGHGGAIDSYRADLQVLPSRGVGVVVLTNFGGADPRQFSSRILRELVRTHALTRRSPRPAPELQAAMQQLLAVYNAWDEAAYKAMLEPTRPPFPEEKDELAGYKKLHGACTAFAPAPPDERRPDDSALRGRYKLTCERGSFEISVEISAASRRIAGFIGTSRDVAPPPEIKKAADGLAALIARWDDGTYKRLVAKPAQKPEARALFDDLRAAHQSCKVAAAVHEGFDWRIELGCERGGGLGVALAMTKNAPSLDRFDIASLPGCPVR